MPNELNDGGPCYPFPGVSTDGTDIPWLVPPYPGMSVRQRYKVAAMRLISPVELPDLRNPPTLASCEYAAHYIAKVTEFTRKVADAMLAEDAAWAAKNVTRELAQQARMAREKGQAEKPTDEAT